MRFTIVVLVVLAVGGLYVATTDRDDAVSSPAPVVTPPTAGVLPEDENQTLVQSADEVPLQSEEPAVGPSDKKPTVINIGEPMDPDDPSTWPQSENTEVINIGEPMDADDPSTWPQSENTEVVNIGEPMDPDDFYTWTQSDNIEVINIGEIMDADDPSTWPNQ